jgi:general stress protein 26
MLVNNRCADQGDPMYANFAGTSGANRKRLAEFSVAGVAEDDAIRDSDSQVWQRASSRSVEKSSASYNRIETRVSTGCAEVRPRQDSDHGARQTRITKNHMDSINQQQPEHNRADLSGAKAVEKMKELVDKAETCFFCTAVTADGSIAARPMSVQEVDDHGNLWFLSADDSHKNEELARDPSVRLFFQASAHSGFLTLAGTANVSRDKARIKELWEPIVKTWFTEGKDDPRITVIKVAPTEGYYWDTKHGAAVAGAKMLIGAAIGKTLDDSIEGRLQF